MATASPVSDPPAHVPPELVIDFDVYAPPGVRDDFYAGWEGLLAPDVPPIAWSVRNGGHWMPTKGAQLAAIYGDSVRFSNRISLLPKAVGEQFFGIPQSMDPPDHTQFRMLLNKVLGPKIINRMDDEIRALAAETIEALRPRGGCNFTDDYAEKLPVSIFMRLVDLPIDDAPELLEINRHIIRPTGEMSVVEANEKLHAYLRGPVTKRLGGEGGDMLSRMINGRVYDRALSVDEALNLAKLVMQGGIDTVSNLLSFAMHFLATEPDFRDALVRDPALIPVAVDELIRRFPVVVGARMVCHDMIYEGVDMRAGDVVAIGTPLHSLDPAANAEPARFDLDRTSRAHSTFGQGAHRCPGAYLARLEAQITLEEWLRRIPAFRVAEDAEVTFRGGVIATVESLPLRWDVAGTVAVPA